VVVVSGSDWALVDAVLVWVWVLEDVGWVSRWGWAVPVVMEGIGVILHIAAMLRRTTPLQFTIHRLLTLFLPIRMRLRPSRRLMQLRFTHRSRTQYLLTRRGLYMSREAIRAL